MLISTQNYIMGIMNKNHVLYLKNSDVQELFIQAGKRPKIKLLIFPKLAELLFTMDGSVKKPIVKMGRSNARKRYVDIYNECLDSGKIKKIITLGTHTLRHSAIVNWLNMQIPINRVQQYAGHSSIQVTQAYTRLSPEDVIDLSGLKIDTSLI